MCCMAPPIPDYYYSSHNRCVSKALLMKLFEFRLPIVIATFYGLQIALNYRKAGCVTTF